MAPNFTHMRSIDLRSDTVTRPSDAMREAMAGADVGDDVLDGDPTLAALGERVAGLLGVEAALWTPTGCMANAIALMHHLTRGDRFLAPVGAHVLEAELGTSAWLAGGLPAALPHDAGPGRPTPATVTTAAGGRGPYFGLTTRLLCLENTHNAAGGAVTPPDEHAALVAAAHDAGLAVHLDGARVWHATAAWRLRKMLGGGIRQGGVLGAAGMVALDGLDDLADDHTHATLLADGLRDRGWPVITPDTNIVLVATADAGPVVDGLAGVGVRAVPFGPGVRFVTHRDVSRADVTTVLERIGELPVPV